MFRLPPMEIGAVEVGRGRRVEPAELARADRDLADLEGRPGVADADQPGRDRNLALGGRPEQVDGHLSMTGRRHLDAPRPADLDQIGRPPGGVGEGLGHRHGARQERPPLQRLRDESRPGVPRAADPPRGAASYLAIHRLGSFLLPGPARGISPDHS